MKIVARPSDEHGDVNARVQMRAAGAEASIDKIK